MAALRGQAQVLTAPERIGRYRIVGEIGRGAMGVVYRAEDEALGRIVAIKTILAQVSDEDQMGYLARFRQEAKALGGLNHPAIITVYEFGDQEGLAYLAMEFLEGRELRQILSSERLPLPIALEIAAQVAEGLSFAHAHGIVHRDIKPSNVMVLQGERAKIMDFGIARVRTSDVKTQTGLLLGSPKYMSPEQVLGRGIESRSDIFSLGVVLSEMLSGVAPFNGESVHQLMFQVCNARPTPPSHLNPAVPPVVDLIVARALEKDPAARYADAAEMARDLRSALAEVLSVGNATASFDGGFDRTHALARTQALERTQTLSGAPPAERTHAMQGTQAMLQDRTQAIGSFGLRPSRRIDSAAALKRLSESRGDDRLALSPSGEAAGGGILADRELLAAAGLVTAAIAIASAIAFA
jgi:eukaryotic-like serine/threonine-protein kinase